ncbi:cell division protein FtsX [Sphingomonas sp.]|uniref:cell division protein FtsX n=1 Tax=Sphingomonas sp. TaxID=28214 RepID=UPI0035BC6BB6
MSAGTSERRVLDEAGGVRAMTWVMAIMVFLTMLAAALGLATAGAARSLDRNLAGKLTVQVIAGDAAARDATAAGIARALRTLPGVRRADVVDRAAMTRLLAPWLGSDGADPDLPVPAMIDVELDDRADGAATGAAVETAVRARSASARVDRHAAWMSPVGGFMRTLTALAAGVVALMASATAVVVVLAVRAGLDAHRATIEVMHMLGSTDVQVARLFQRRIAIDAAFGGACGGVAAVAMLAVLGTQASGLGSELLGQVALGPLDWVAIAILPFAFVVLGMAAARVSVTRALGRTL